MDAEIEVEKLRLEQLCKTCEEKYLKNPTDADNLITWGAVLTDLLQFASTNERLRILGEAVSKLEEALTINPAKHQANWLLGNVYNVIACSASDLHGAKALLEEALRCFKKAVDTSPGNETYLKSLVATAEYCKKLKENNTQEELGQAQQTSDGVPAASSRATCTAKKPSSDLKYAIGGWVILAVGIVTWLGMAQSRMPPPPSR